MRSFLPPLAFKLLLGLVLLLPACQSALVLTPATATATTPAATSAEATEAAPTETRALSTRPAETTTATQASPAATPTPTRRPSATPPAPTPPPLGLKIQKSPGDLFEPVFSIPIGLQGVHYRGVGVFGAQKSGPQAMTVAEDGSFYIADTVGRQVLHYGPRGSLLAAIDLKDQAGRLVDLAAGPEGLYLLNLGEPANQLLFLPDPDQPPQTWALPDTLGPEFGLEGIALSQDGRLLLEGAGGSLLAWDGPQGGQPERLEGYPAGERVFRADFPNLLAGDVTVPLSFTTGLGSLRLLAAFPQGSFLVLQEDMLSLDDARMDTLIHYYEADGSLLGQTRVPTKDQYLPVAHSLAVAADGQVYWMQTRLDSVRIVRLLFYPQLASP